MHLHHLTTALLSLAALSSTASASPPAANDNDNSPANLFPRQNTSPTSSNSNSITTTNPPTTTPTRPTNSLCAHAGGACLDTATCQSQPGGVSIAGLCPESASHIRCCKFTEPLPECIASAGSQSPSRLVGCVTDEVCQREKGTSYAGLCPGPKEIRCCVGPVGYNVSTANSVIGSGSSSASGLGNGTGSASRTVTEGGAGGGRSSSTTTAAVTTEEVVSSSDGLRPTSTSTGGARRLGYRADGYGNVWESWVAGLAGVAAYLI